MARTTTELVMGVIDVDLEEVPDLTPFIDAANELVTEFCDVTPAVYTATRLRMIETWLAAHFYAVRERRTIMERAGTVMEQYDMGKVDLGLMLTWYGQQALTLDTHGFLANANAGTTNPGVVHKKIDITWLGTEDP